MTETIAPQITTKDREILRRLAEEVAELAAPVVGPQRRIEGEIALGEPLLHVADVVFRDFEALRQQPCLPLDFADHDGADLLPAYHKWGSK